MKLFVTFELNVTLSNRFCVNRKFVKVGLQECVAVKTSYNHACPKAQKTTCKMFYRTFSCYVYEMNFSTTGC